MIIYYDDSNKKILSDKIEQQLEHLNYKCFCNSIRKVKHFYKNDYFNSLLRRGHNTYRIKIFTRNQKRSYVCKQNHRI